MTDIHLFKTDGKITKQYWIEHSHTHEKKTGTWLNKKSKRHDDANEFWDNFILVHILFVMSLIKIFVELIQVVVPSQKNITKLIKKKVFRYICNMYCIYIYKAKMLKAKPKIMRGGKSEKNTHKKYNKRSNMNEWIKLQAHYFHYLKKLIYLATWLTSFLSKCFDHFYHLTFSMFFFLLIKWHFCVL